MDELIPLAFIWLAAERQMPLVRIIAPFVGKLLINMGFYQRVSSFEQLFQRRYSFRLSLSFGQQSGTFFVVIRGSLYMQNG